MSTKLTQHSPPVAAPPASPPASPTSSPAATSPAATSPAATSPAPEPPIPQPILTIPSPHLLLRAHHPSDAPAIQLAADTPAVARYMGRSFRSPFPPEDAHRLIAFANGMTLPGHEPADTPLCYAICDAATNTFLGTVGARTRPDVESGTLELGYWLGEASWGRGIMTAVLRAYARWVFGEFQEVNRLEALVFEGNEASRRVVEKVGFVYEGTRRKAGEKDGRVFDIRVFGLLREECV